MSSRQWRASRSISKYQLSSLAVAQREATVIGFPFTHSITLNFWQTAVEADEETEALRKLLKEHFRRWLNRMQARSKRPAGLTYAWVRENDPVGMHHAHLLLHVPARLTATFLERFPIWFERVAGPIAEPNALDIRAAHEQSGIYLTKGAQPEHARLYGQKKCRPQGIVLGKRAAISMNLAPAARRRRRQSISKVA